MEANNETKYEGLLKLELLRRKNMKDRFRLPYTKEYVKKALATTFETEILGRSQSFLYSRDLDEQLTQIAKCLTGTTGKFGLIFCGGVGNGKSTMMKAIQSLLNVLRLPNSYDSTYYGLRIVDAKYVNELTLHDYNAFLGLSRKSSFHHSQVIVEERTD